MIILTIRFMIFVYCNIEEIVDMYIVESQGQDEGVTIKYNKIY